MTYSGIEIHEGKLLTLNIVFTLTLLALFGIAVFAIVILRDPDKMKQKARIKRLQKQAEADPRAQKQLAKQQRNYKRRFKDDFITKIITYPIILILIVISLVFCVIPGWVDYAKKDYVIYYGSVESGFEVHRFVRTSYIELNDGTRITGGLGLENGMHTKTIVYSKRSRIALGVAD